MYTATITILFLLSTGVIAYLRMKCSNSEKAMEALKKDNQIKALSIERHLREKMELQQNYAKKSIDLSNSNKELSTSLELKKAEVEFYKKNKNELISALELKETRIEMMKAV